MHILAIETSAPRASLALLERATNEVVWENNFATDRAHNARIFQPLSEALEFSGREIDFIAVGIGPGSYSGVRIGIAAANGVAIALEIPVAGLSSLELFDVPNGNYAVAGDARRSTFFLADVSGQSLTGDPDLLSESEFAKRLEAIPDSTPILTPDRSLAKIYRRVREAHPCSRVLARRSNTLFRRASGIPDDPVEPHYLRPPYITQAKKKPVPGFPKSKT